MAHVCGVTAAGAQTTALYIDSQPGDPIGRGLKQTWTPSSLTFTASAETFAFSDLTVIARSADFSTRWSMFFGAPQLVPGIYENSIRSTFSSVLASPLLDVSGPGIGCNGASGRFQIYEIVLGPSGTVTSFAADFEQHCNGMAPALFGAIRYNSSRSSLVPFDGAYPVYSLHLDGSANGYVTATGIDCGAGRSDCDETYEPNTLVALHATPSPGYVFVGWAGDCRGDQDATVTITRRRFCMAVFNAAPGSGGVESPDLSDAALALDGVPGLVDAPPGRRVKQVFATFSASSPINSVLTPTQVSVNQLQFQVVGPGGAVWTLAFGAPGGAALTTGSYSYTVNTASNGGQLPLLSLSPVPNLVSCNSGGRFTIHELNISLGVVTGFAVDFELPCAGQVLPAAPVAGSLRYRSARANLLPFDGGYPLYALHVSSTLGGFVTAAGISCGDGGRTDCDEVYSAPALVSLQATPSAGYQFVVWSGSCSDQIAATAVTVDAAERCIAVFAPLPAGAVAGDPSLATASLLIDTLGTTSPGRTIWFGDETSVSVPSSQPYSVTLTFTSPNRFPTSSSVAFSIPAGRLQPGDYEDAYSNPDGRTAGLSLSSCFNSVGRFRIYEATFDAAGRLLTFAADFEVLCPYPAPPHVVGAVRFNSTRSRMIPFDGAYPVSKLTIDPTVNGIVTAAGIDCGPGHPDCTETYAPGLVALQATPLPGYRFVGWSGACDGPSMTTVLVDWPKRCSAIFDAVVPGLGTADLRTRYAFMIDSQPGDRIGGGRRHIWLDANIFGSGTGLAQVNIQPPDGGQWFIYLKAPNNQQLVPGSYENAGSPFSSGPAPGLYVSSSAGTCSSGRFVVYEIAYDPFNTSIIRTLAADFEVQCAPGVTSLLGSIRLNSTRSILKPFAPTTFTAVPLPSRPDFNRDGLADFVWRHTVSGHNAIWFMNGVNLGSTTFFLPSGAEQLTDLTWEIRATADMNRDGFPDVIWQNSATGRIAVWFFRSATRVSTDYLYNAGGGSVEPDLNWKIVAAADMDRDGQTDLVWRNRATGALRIWHMNGVVQTDSVPIATVADLNWEIAGVGDMNGDGMPDLIWRYATTGGLASWFLYDALIQSTVWLSPSEMADTRWHIVGVADMNADGKSDLVWQNFTTGELGVWFMNGILQTGGRYLNPSSVSDPKWRIVGVR